MTSEDARVALGRQVRDVRQGEGISIETAAERGGVGHMSWRKIERGQEVRQRTYVGIDRAFDWPIGHTLACLQAGNALRTSTPPNAPGTSLDPAALGIDKDSENDFNDPFSVILENIERLSLTQLEGLQVTIRHMCRDRRSVLDAAQSTLQSSRTNSNLYFDFNGRYLFDTSKGVSDQYESAFRRYMEAWTNMADFQIEVSQAEKGEIPSKKYLVELTDRINKHSKELDESIEKLNSAETAAIKDLYDRDKAKEGDTDGVDT